ncbi:30S ribosomal protein S2 [Candidatus Peregrinibacteria bacterium]|nr:30S ribosomal protein S2 [Candidatus Peregrinibacteria bacterium]
MQKDEIKKMFDCAVHIGHRTQKWNPRMKRYIYGERNGIHIINLEKTYEMLEKALAFLSKYASEGKTVLFVSTKPQSLKLIEKLAHDCHMPYVVSKWIPGLITNFSTIKTRIKYLADLKSQEASGELAKYTKKEISKLKKIIDKLQIALGGVQNMNSRPDVVFVVDALRDKIVVKEARRMRIPVVAIVDTNADPTLVDYPIPGNDDAIKSLTYFVDLLREIFEKTGNAKK